MIAPHGAPSFSEAMRYGVEVYHALRGAPERRRAHHRRRRRGRLRAGARLARGGARPDGRGDPQGAGSVPGRDVAIALDTASSELVEGDAYVFRKARRLAPLVGRPDRALRALVPDLPDRLDRGRARRERLERLEAAHGPARRRRCSSSATTSSCTNEPHPRPRHHREVGNAILIKVNQIGTLTETRATMARAERAGYRYDRVASLGRDRGRVHRRPGGRHRLRVRSRPARRRARSGRRSTTGCW